ncbi:SIR2 family protein [Mesorhizobium neociceri]|uniref:SIR2 family protein n=1 Tax=Mesorhizobium neociceri TaxID=1307853 RepID=A0A838AY00_9HYPH|nr:SIR2 family protein [Mesorhizobium neociceri]MBA1138723.1 SIR2 family protein [Mesorhizobium neociceri]
MDSSAVSPNGPVPVGIKDLTFQLKLAKSGHKGGEDERGPGAVFLVGAGCSQSAGIPMASQIAQELTLELASLKGALGSDLQSCQTALAWLDDRQHLPNLSTHLPGFDVSKPMWGRLYGYLFEEFFRSDNEQRSIIRDAIDRGQGRINWAHICLGEIVRCNYAHTIMTTNFDQLVLQGIILTGMIPVVADGLSALSRVVSRPNHPQVIHLHGSMHTYELRNSASDIHATQEALSMQGTIFGLKDSGLLVVVGYSGSEDGGVVTLLEKAFAAIPNLLVFWVLYEESIDALNHRVRAMLTGRNKFVILNQDADRFFGQLVRGLGFGAPNWMENPLSILDAVKDKIVEPTEPVTALAKKDFGAKLDRFRNAPTASPDDIILERATIDSLGGRDSNVIEGVSEEMAATDPDAARLRAISLGRLGNADKASSLLAASVAAWDAFFRSSGADDGKARTILAQTLLDLAEAPGNQNGEQSKEAFRQAMENFRAATQAISLNLARSDWIESALGFAESVAEQGDEGAAENDLTAAIEILDKVLTVLTGGPQSRQQLSAEERLGVLLYMRARRTKSESDYRRAIAILDDVSQRAVNHESWSVGVVRNLAVAFRGLAELIQDKSPDEATASYQRAAQLYQDSAEKYLGGLRDLDERDALQAAIWAYEEAEKLYRVLNESDAANAIGDELRKARTDLETRA